MKFIVLNPPPYDETHEEECLSCLLVGLNPLWLLHCIVAEA